MANAVPETFGILAGRGFYPELMCKEARAAGVKNIAVVGLIGDTSPGLEEHCDSIEWVYVGQLKKTIKSMKKRGVKDMVMVGQVKPGRLFKGMRPDLKALRIQCRQLVS